MADREPWQQEFLEHVEPLHEMSVEDSRAIVAFFVLDKALSSEPEAWERIFSGDESEVAIRMYELGRYDERARYYRDLQPDVSSAPIPGLDPTLAALVSEGVEADRLPNVRRLHLHAQAAMLRAIERAAESTSDAQELNALSDAYLRMPAPDED